MRSRRAPGTPGSATAVSHSLICPFWSEEAKTLPSGENFKNRTRFVCPFKVAVNSPVDAFHNWMFPFSQPEANLEPSAEKVIDQIGDWPGRVALAIPVFASQSLTLPSLPAVASVR